MSSTCLASISLFVLAVHHGTRHNTFCNTANPSSFRSDYGRLIADLHKLPIVQNKVPPKVNKFRHGFLEDEETIHIYLTIAHIALLKLDPATQLLDMIVDFEIRWTDTDLAWNSSDYGGVDSVELQLGDVWVPNLIVINSPKTDELAPSQGVPLILRKDGTIYSNFASHLTTVCPLDLGLFPFDTQICEANIISVKETGGHTKPSDLVVHNEEKFSSGSEWRVNEIKIEKGTFSPLDFKHFNNIRIEIKLQRIAIFYIESILLVMTLFCYMNCFVFLIPIESNEKFHYITTIFVSNAVVTSFIEINMPKGITHGVPLIMDFLCFMWLWSMVVFIATIYVFRRFSYDDHKHEGHETLELKDWLRGRRPVLVRKHQRGSTRGANRVTPIVDDLRNLKQESAMSSHDKVTRSSVQSILYFLKTLLITKLDHSSLDFVFFIFGNILTTTVLLNILETYKEG